MGFKKNAILLSEDAILLCEDAILLCEDAIFLCKLEFPISRKKSIHGQLFQIIKGSVQATNRTFLVTFLIIMRFYVC